MDRINELIEIGIGHNSGAALAEVLVEETAALKERAEALIAGGQRAVATDLDGAKPATSGVRWRNPESASTPRSAKGNCAMTPGGSANRRRRRGPGRSRPAWAYRRIGRAGAGRRSPISLWRSGTRGGSTKLPSARWC